MYSIGFSPLSCSGKNFKMPWKSHGKLREFSLLKMWSPCVRHTERKTYLQVTQKSMPTFFHNGKSWCTMAEFQTLPIFINKTYEGFGSNFARP